MQIPLINRELPYRVSKLTGESPQQTCPDQGMRRTSARKAFKCELWKCLKSSKTKVIHKQMRLIPEIIPEFENIMTYSNYNFLASIIGNITAPAISI